MNKPAVPFEATTHVRDACLCLHAQRAARVLARRFDAVLRPAGLTNEQFSLLMALNRPRPALVGEVAALIGADRTTLTAAFKTLSRRGLVTVDADSEDARMRRITLTEAGHARLSEALPLWTQAHADLEAELDRVDPSDLRNGLKILAAPGSDAPTLCDDKETTR